MYNYIPCLEEGNNGTHRGGWINKTNYFIITRHACCNMKQGVTKTRGSKDEDK